MFGAFGSKRDPWEELYDFDTNTYFYRHKGTGEFSRFNPIVVEAKSTHVPARSTDPLWETMFDNEGNIFWTDLETGKVAFARPDKGTFVTETPLKDFRRAATKIATKKSRLSTRQSTATRQSMARKSMRVVKRDDDFGIVSADSSDLDFEKLFGNASPANFDAAALYMNAQSNTSISVPSSPVVEMRRLSTRDGAETPDFPILDEEAVLAQSTIVTDNPLFRYGK